MSDKNTSVVNTDKAKNYQIIDINKFVIKSDSKDLKINTQKVENSNGQVKGNKEVISEVDKQNLNAPSKNDADTFTLIAGVDSRSTDTVDGNYSKDESNNKAENVSVGGSYQHDQQYKPIPVYMNPKIERYIKVYTVKKRNLFQKGLNRSVHYVEMMKRIFREEGLPEELIYLSAVESNFNYKAISRARAVGIWQFMSFTGKDYDLTQSWWHDERYNPVKSTRAAAQYLKDLYKKFDNWELALAAYNSGPNRVRRAIKHNAVRNLQKDYWHLKLPRETRGYVPAFLALTHIMKNLNKYGFGEKSPHPEVRTAKLKVPGGISLKDVAKEIGVSHSKLKSINPALKYQITPGNVSTYKIDIPSEINVEDETKLYAKLSKKAVRGWLKHKVRKGDTIWDIARNYDVRRSDIVRYNKSARKKYLRLGTYLLIPSAGSIARTKNKRYNNSGKSNVVYRVKKGDTLSRISKLYNTSIKALVSLNQGVISSKHVLLVGMELMVR